jgi:hypothetical protein
MRCVREGCNAHAIKGGTICNKHGGAAPHVKAHAAVRDEVSRWTLGDAVDDPVETMLRLITQSRRRLDLYADLLQKAYDAAERLRTADIKGDVALDADARRDLQEVLSTGGVAALVGKTWGAAGKDGDIYATGEAIRGLAALEATERDRLARFCKLAIDAGIAERQVRLAERLGASLVALLDGVARALGHDPADPDVRRVIEGQLVAVEAGAA